MKFNAIKEGTIVALKEHPKLPWGAVLYKTTRGHILVRNFVQDTRHFITAQKFIEFAIVVEEDNGGYHGYCPALKGLHIGGADLQEVQRNFEDAITAYLLSMIKHGEIKFNGNTRRYEIGEVKDG